MEGLLQLSYLPTHSQSVDVQFLPSQQHWLLLNKLGMFPYHLELEEGCWRPLEKPRVSYC